MHIPHQEYSLLQIGEQLLQLRLIEPLTARAQQAGFSDWAVVVVAADWRSSQGAPIEAFENARRDLSAAFAEAGFAPDNITDLSLRPGPDGRATPASAVLDAIGRQTAAATGGAGAGSVAGGGAAGLGSSST